MFTGVKNQVLRFVLNLIILFLIVLAIDRTGGVLSRRLYFSQKDGENYRTTYSLDSTNADILVFGSSRANHHYIPEVFEDSLKMSFCNTGRDGSYLLYNYAIFKSIIKRYTPKIIILDISHNELFYNSLNYDCLSSLLPYYYSNPEIQSIINLRGPYERYKLLSSVYPFNSGLLTLISNNFNSERKPEINRKGYIPLYGSMNNIALTNLNDTSTVYDPANFDAINSICSICKSRNIKLFFIQSPFYANISETSSTLEISKLARQYNASFISYFNDQYFIKRPSLFKDLSHLNDAGAIVFSGMIVNQIKKVTSDNIACK
jgi:hypothetical protein